MVAVPLTTFSVGNVPATGLEVGTRFLVLFDDRCLLKDAFRELYLTREWRQLI